MQPLLRRGWAPRGRRPIATVHPRHPWTAGDAQRVARVLDGAGWPRGHPVALPPYSPERQPAERLWALSDTPPVNRHFADLDALEAAQADRCRELFAQPATGRAHTHFHWWPDTG